MPCPKICPWVKNEKNRKVPSWRFPPLNFSPNQKNDKNPYLHPNFSPPHSCCPNILSEKKNSQLNEDIWLWEIKKKTRKKQKLRNELFKGLRLYEFQNHCGRTVICSHVALEKNWHMKWSFYLCPSCLQHSALWSSPWFLSYSISTYVQFFDNHPN